MMEPVMMKLHEFYIKKKMEVKNKMYYYIMDENYNIKYLIKNKREIYKRVGKCNICGTCCVALKIENRGEDGMCKFLKDNKCIIQDSKPMHCRMSPINPEIHKYIPECGYSWKKTSWRETKREIRKHKSGY